MSDFTLDTSNMSSVAESCKKLADKMRTTHQTLDNSKTELISSWEGKGSNTFQKKYHVLIRQLADIGDELYELSEKIYKDEDSYIQADMDLAKATSGVQSPGQASS